MAILVGLKLFITVVLICISLMVNDAEHLFVCLLAISISSLEKRLLRSFAHLKSWVVCFLLLSFKSSSYFLDTRPLSDIQFKITFSHSVGCFFALLKVSFDAPNF